MVEDEHKPAKQCIVHFSIKSTYTSPIVLTLHQLHHRFLHDPASMTSYQYANLKMSLVKVGKTITNSEEVQPDMVAFVDGDQMAYSHSHIELSGLNAGDYLVISRGSWTESNPSHKLILNLYAPDLIPLNRVLSSRLPDMTLAVIEDLLETRVYSDSPYTPPGFAVPQQ